jgi:hypothetical protein
MSVIQPDLERLSQLQCEIQDFGAALGIVEGRTQNEERIAGNKQREAVQPEIDRLGNIYANAFLATHTAALDYDSFVNRLEDAGGNISTLRLSPAGLMGPSDRNSQFAYGLKEFIDSGFFLKSNMPKVLK